MGASISSVYIRTYENTVRHLAQQGITRLEPWVDSRNVQSESHNWERMAKTTADMNEKTTRKTATPDDDTQWSRRQSQPQVFHIGDVTEHSDIGQMLVDPNSNYARAHAMAARRRKDRVIIAAAVGDSRDGGGGTVTFPAGQDIGGAAVAPSYDLITETSEIFMKNDVDPDEQKVFVISPAFARKLLQLTEATSGDYNATRPLTSKGYIESWMGYTWIVSTLLETPDASTSHYCFAMTRKAIGLQMNRDIWVRIAEDPSISFAWRVYCEMQLGAIRVEDEQLVRVRIAGAPV